MSPSQLAVHTFTNQPWSIHECIENYARAEIRGISVWRETIAGYNLKKVRKQLEDSGITPVSLVREAQIMKALGCHEAMNLDGGTSLALAKGDRILRRANRNLTNVITVYDVQHPAPSKLRLSWETFQTIDRQS